MIRFACPGCQSVFTVEDAKGGKTGKCPKCEARFTIPMAESAASAAAPSPSVPEMPTVPPPPPRRTDPNEAVEIQPCPQCNARLSVTRADLGADVECPYCQKVYEAIDTSAPAAPRPSKSGSRSSIRDVMDEETAPPPSSRRRSRRSSDDDDEDDELPTRRSRSRRSTGDDDDEDEAPPRRRRSRSRYDEDDEEDRPSRRRPRKRKRASSGGDAGPWRVMASIMALIFGVFPYGCCGFGWLLELAIGFGELEKQQAKIQDETFKTLMAFGIGCIVVFVLLAAIYFMAGLGGLQRKPYGRILLIITGFISILTSLPLFFIAGTALIKLNFCGIVFFGLAALIYVAQGVSALLGTFPGAAAAEYTN